MTSFVSALSQFDLAAFVLVLARAVAFLTAAPLFRQPRIPRLVVAALAVLIAAAVYPRVQGKTGLGNEIGGEIAIYLLREVTVGVALGFAARVLFAAFEVGGSFMATSMGLGFASLVDPESGQQTESVSNLMRGLAILMFLALDGHVLLFRALAQSYDVAGPAAAAPSTGFLLGIARMGGQMFVLGLQVAAPVMAALFVTHVALAIVARLSPQMNVFVISFSITILVGILVLLFAAPYLGGLMARMTSQLTDHLMALLARI